MFQADEDTEKAIAAFFAPRLVGGGSPESTTLTIVDCVFHIADLPPIHVEKLVIDGYGRVEQTPDTGA